MFLEIVIFVGLAAYLFYRWSIQTFNTFSERGVAFEAPIPLLGNMKDAVFLRSSLAKLIAGIYMRNKSHKIVGIYNFRNPIFMVNDIEAIKKMTVKDFEYFPNHKSFVPDDDDKLLNSMLTVMKDKRWKNMRHTLTPAFTGAKMRAMFPLMNECFNETLKYFSEQSKNGQGIDVEMKDCMNRLSNDIIASTAFGLQTNSYTDKNNEFYSVGSSIVNFRGAQLFKFFFFTSFPKLANLLRMKIFDQAKTEYFMRLVMDTMKYRDEKKIHRADMIQLMMEARKDSNQNWTDEDIVAQCFIFFFAAFENNALLTSLMCHDLLENPDCQQRLYEEVKDMDTELAGAPLGYDDVTKMKYLDMVVSETLRKWSIAQVTDRVCSKDYKLTDENNKFIFEFKAGDHIWIPIVGIHRDPDYFENPNDFDPERFSDENKDNIKPFTYIPFGAGPRNCIGNRYALMQAKAMIYYLVLRFKIQASPKTVHDIWEEGRGFQLTPKGGFNMTLVPRASK